jgi:hypothetical protein
MSSSGRLDPARLTPAASLNRVRFVDFPGIGRSLTMRLLHDGSAAAQALAGKEHAAVMMLGTALGVGFPPASGLGWAAHSRHVSP